MYNSTVLYSKIQSQTSVSFFQTEFTFWKQPYNGLLLPVKDDQVGQDLYGSPEVQSTQTNHLPK